MLSLSSLSLSGLKYRTTFEEIPKAWLERNILNRRYRETADQASFSSVIDVPLALTIPDTVLLVTASYDQAAGLVEKALTDSGEKWFRLDTWPSL